MKITLELLGILADRDDAVDRLELPADATIQQVVEELDLVHGINVTFTVNNRIVRDRAHVLREGDHLIIVPPVIGG